MMQTTLDKFYPKSRGQSAGLGKKFLHKGPAKKLFTDDKLDPESYDKARVAVVSTPSIVKVKSSDEVLSETSVTENICYTPSKLHLSEAVTKIETSPIDNICHTPVKSHHFGAKAVSKIETDEADLSEKDELISEPVNKPPIVFEPVPSTSELEVNNLIVPKTPSSRLCSEDACSTPIISPSTRTVLRKNLGLGEFSKLSRDSKRNLSRKRPVGETGDSRTSPTNICLSMNNIYASPKLKKFDMVQVEITSPVKRGTLKPRRLFGPSILSSPKKNISYISPSKLLAEGPIKSPQPSPRKLSLERVDYLLAEGKEALVLPRKYLDLEETFRWIETIMKIRISRMEVVTFNTIRIDVQKATGRRFIEEHLGQIKAVYPNAYDLSRQLMKLPMNREKTHELVISVRDNASTLAREKTFHNYLIERTKVHHQKFLEQFDPSLQIPASEVKRWHREFSLNDVPDIEAAPIPKPPTTDDFSVSAKNLLEKTHTIISGNKRLERAMSTLSEENIKTESPKLAEPVSPVVCRKTAALQKALKGVSPVLLQKIRAKQAAKYAQDITRTPAAAKEAIMLSRLPEIAKILRVVFVKEKKSILPEELVLRVVGQSFKEKMPAKDLKEHFELLSKHLPGWMNSCKVENKPYVRLSKDADMTRVLGRLQKLIETS